MCLGRNIIKYVCLGRNIIKGVPRPVRPEVVDEEVAEEEEGEWAESGDEGDCNCRRELDLVHDKLSAG